MRKSIFIPVLLIVLIVGLLFTYGCSKPAAVPVDPARPADPSKPADPPKPDKVFELTFNDWGPEVIPPGQLALKAIAMIEERTNGNVKITPYFSGSLIEYPDTYSSLSAGIADISLIGLDRFKGVHIFNFLLARLFEEDAPRLKELHKVYRSLLVDIPELQEEMKGKNTIWLDVWPLPANQLHTTKKPVRTPADLKGMRITANGDLRDLVDLMGAAGVSVSPGEWYMSLERGLVDGQLTHWEGIRGFDMLNLFQYHTNFGVGGTDSTVLGFQMNLDTWNSLPVEYQDIIVDSFMEAGDWMIDLIEDVHEVMEQLAIEKGHTIINLTSEERKEFAKYFREVNDKWIADAESKGWPAKKSYDHLMNLFVENR